MKLAETLGLTLMLVLGIGILGMVAMMVLTSMEESQEWERFKVDHKCKAVAHIKGDAFNTVGLDSKGGVVIGVGATPDKTGWKCDDGKMYYR